MIYFLFDIDGTLINSEKMYWQALLDILQKYDYTVTFEEFHEVFGKTMEDALYLCGITKNNEKILQEWNQILPNYKNSIDVFDGIENMLLLLSKNSETIVGVATSETPEEYKNNVYPLSIHQYFDSYTLSSEVKKPKPAPDIIFSSVNKLNALNKRRKLESKTIIYIGDTYSDLLAAHSAGVLFGLAGWSVKGNDRRKFLEADYIFEVPKDILWA